MKAAWWFCAGPIPGAPCPRAVVIRKKNGQRGGKVRRCPDCGREYKKYSRTLAGSVSSKRDREMAQDAAHGLPEKHHAGAQYLTRELDKVLKFTF